MNDLALGGGLRPPSLGDKRIYQLREREDPMSAILRSPSQLAATLCSSSDPPDVRRRIMSRVCGVTRTLKSIDDPDPRRPGRRRNKLYDLDDFNAEYKRRFGKVWPAGTKEILHNRRRFVCEELLPPGVNRQTADAWSDGEMIPSPIMINIEVAPRKKGEKGCAPARLKMWSFPDLQHRLEWMNLPEAARLKTREKSDLLGRDRQGRWLLHEDIYVPFREAKLLGFTKYYLVEHSDYHHKRRRHDPSPAPPISRLVRTEKLEFVNARGHLIEEPGYRLGDLRDILERRDNPILPSPDGRLINDQLIAALKAIGIKTCRQTLTKMIDDGVCECRPRCARRNCARSIVDGLVVGGRIDGFKKNLAPEKLLWFNWEAREKIPQPKPIPDRVFWFDRRYWFPRREAQSRTGLSSFEMRRRMPRDFGGLDNVHTELGRAVRCAYHPETFKIVLDGGDVDRIIEKRTGVRPAAPVRPQPATPPTTRQRGGKRPGAGPKRKDWSPIERLHADYVAACASRRLTVAEFAQARGRDPHEVGEQFHRLRKRRSRRREI